MRKTFFEWVEFEPHGNCHVGVAIIGAGALGAGASIYGADKASNQQATAAQNALGAQQQMFQQTQANLQPYENVGSGATYTLGSLYGIDQNGSTGNTPDFSQFTNSPDYAFAQQQGNLGLQRYENANGLALSGGALKDAATFNQGLATQQFGNYYNRLLSLSQLGAGAASSAAGSGANFSGQIGNTTQAVGQANAAGTVGASNAISSGLNSSINNTLLYNAINRSSYAPSSGLTSPLPGSLPLGQGGIGSA